MKEYKAVIANIEYFFTDGEISDMTTERRLLSNGLEIGNIAVTQLNLTVVTNMDDLGSMDEIEFFMRDDTAVNWENRGKYYITSRPQKNKGDAVNIEAWNAIGFLTEPLLIDGNPPAYPMSCANILSAFNIPVNADTQNILKPYFMSFEPDTPKEEILCEIAAAHGGNFIMTYDNKLKIIQIGVSGNSHNVGTIFAGLTTDKTQRKITRVTLTATDNISFTSGNDDGKHIKLNIFNAAQTMCDNLLAQLNGYLYKPFSAEKAVFIDDFESGDTVVLKGENYDIFNFKTYYSSILRSDISAPYSNEGGLAFSRGGGNSTGGGIVQMPQIAYGYNENSIFIEQNETTIATIEVDAASGETLGNVTVKYLSEENTTVIFRLYDNDVQELLSPILQQAKPGENEITISNHYIKLLPDIHIFSVTAQTASGRIILNGARQVAFTMYLIQREIVRLTYNIYDLTISQPENALEPVSVYAVAVEDGDVVILRARFIKGRRYNGNDFTEQFRIEGVNAKRAAIESNGVFKRISHDSIVFTLVTEDFPYVFWTDEYDNLYVQKYDNVSTRVWIATEVSEFTVCRLWNSLDFPDRDMGLVAAMIKYNGYVAYKGLYDNGWDVEYPIEQAGNGNSFVHVFRLNDYRAGFAVTGINELYITDRYYVGQSVKDEYNNLHAQAIANVCFNNNDFNFGVPKITDVEFINPYKIKVYFNYPIGLKSDLNSNINDNIRVGQPSASDYKTLTNLEIENGNLIIEFAQNSPVSVNSDLWVSGANRTFLYFKIAENYQPYLFGAYKYAGKPIQIKDEYNSLSASAEIITLNFNEIKEVAHKIKDEYNSLSASAEIITLNFNEIKEVARKIKDEYNSLSASAEIITLNFMTTGGAPI